MTVTDSSRSVPTVDQVRTWLVDRAQYFLPDVTTRLDHSASLIECGLDSVYAVQLCGEIEDTWGIPVDPVLLWDVDTIDRLTDHIVARTTDRSAA